MVKPVGRRGRRATGWRRGVAAMEFALCLPPFFLVVIATAELSNYMSDLYMVQRAVRDGARVGSTTLEGPDADGTLIEAAAIDQVEAVLEGADRPCVGACQILAEWHTVDGDPYRYVTVYVSQPYQSIAPGISIVPAQVTARLTMLTQQQ